ncbi:MAG: radical SAM protein, partial [bacterium]|nr:radical SAM protein [bacterium]
MNKELTAPCLVVSDSDGRLFEIPDLLMTGMAINFPVVPDPADIITLPEGSDLFALPARKPIGYDPASEEFIQLDKYGGREVFAAAAFMTPAYVQLYRSAYTADPHTVKLPLYAYTAIGWQNHNFCVTGIRIDTDPRQDHRGFNSKLIEKSARQMAARYPKNRLVQHLMENCVRRYGCPAARNLALGRWECPVPTSSW